MPVTEQQARAITFLAMAARPTHAPRWDESGIFANVMKVSDRSLSAVVIAVIQAAEDRNAQSPGVIPTAGPHWRNPQSAPTVQREAFDPKRVCHVCAQLEHPPTDHRFVSVEAKRAVAPAPRPAAVAVVRDGLCSHGLRPMNCADHRPAPPAKKNPQADPEVAAARAEVRKHTHQEAPSEESA